MNIQTEIDSFSEKPSGNAKPFAEVVFNLPLREAFTYKIPPQLLGKVRVGMRVLVPFGRRRITGYVVNLTDKWDKPIRLKAIVELPDTEPIVSAELLSLTRWLGEYYQSSWGEAISAVAAVLVVPISQAHYLMGLDPLLLSFIVVIIGGLGSFWGTLAGGIIIGVAQTLGAAINPEWQILAGHVAFLVVLLARPRGLFPRATD